MAHPATERQQPLLSVRDLHVAFPAGREMVTAVDHVSYSVASGEVLAIVGESGSGKSVSARALLRLVPPPGRVVGGVVEVFGEDLLRLPDEKMRAIRGRRIALVPQDPLTAFNPVFPVGWQIAEVLRIHNGTSVGDARTKTIQLMQRVRIPDAARRYSDYPYQFSGGMRQRALIAMALALSPELLIADEPTTALDVTTQAQILGLLAELQAESGMSIILITHDLGVVAEIADRTMVMYAGRIAEVGKTRQTLSRPAHPYTRGLRDSLPRMDEVSARLVSIVGTPPDLSQLPSGCAFHPRCPYAVPDLCANTTPALREVDERRVACHIAEEVLKLGEASR